MEWIGLDWIQIGGRVKICSSGWFLWISGKQKILSGILPFHNFGGICRENLFKKPSLLSVTRIRIRIRKFYSAKWIPPHLQSIRKKIITTIIWLWVRTRQYRWSGLMESARINPKNPQGDYLFRPTYDLLDQIRWLLYLKFLWKRHWGCRMGFWMDTLTCRRPRHPHIPHSRVPHMFVQRSRTWRLLFFAL